MRAAELTDVAATAERLREDALRQARAAAETESALALDEEIARLQAQSDERLAKELERARQEADEAHTRSWLSRPSELSGSVRRRGAKSSPRPRPSRGVRLETEVARLQAESDDRSHGSSSMSAERRRGADRRAR